MKKTIVLVLTLSLGLFVMCKKKDDKKEDPAPTTTTTGSTTSGTPVFGDGFKMTDNSGNSYVADSSVCRPNSTGEKIAAYLGQYAGIPKTIASFTFKHKTLRAKTYPVDSLDLLYTQLSFDNFSKHYIPKSGSITISSLANNKASGTFTFDLNYAAGTTDGPTSVTGIFNNIKVK